MNIQLDKSAAMPLYQQIVEQVEAQIGRGDLLPGDRLPPERKLAQQLGVNRTTVLTAYRELKSKGIVDSRVGQGTVVLELLEKKDNDDPAPEWGHFLSSYAGRSGGAEISELLNLASREGMVSFAAGIAAFHGGLLTTIQEITEQLLRERPKQSLMLSPVEGFSSLRCAIAGYMQARGCATSPEEVLVLSGSQQGIDLCARVLLDPGDVVVVEEPTYFPALQIFRAMGARVIGVPMDEQGMRLDSLELLLQRHRPKFIYTMPSYHNPTGYAMPPERRQRLVKLARQYKTLLLEDDAYGAFHYDSPPLLPLKGLDDAGYVIYLSTFTKMAYPGIRMGWLSAHPTLLRRLSAARQLVDVHPNSMSQLIAEQLLDSGAMERHMEAVRRDYRKRRDLLLQALEEYARPGMCWTVPTGGYYVWCRLPEGILAERLLPVAARMGVAFVPGTQFYPGEGGERQMRLNFTYVPMEDIPKGIRLLCDAVRELENDRPKAAAHIKEVNPIL